MMKELDYVRRCKLSYNKTYHKTVLPHPATTLVSEESAWDEGSRTHGYHRPKACENLRSAIAQTFCLEVSIGMCQDESCEKMRREFCLSPVLLTKSLCWP